MRKVRLSEKQIHFIKKFAKEVFGEDCKVYIFGSRADVSKRGGDIDILIITNNTQNLFRKKLKFLAKLSKAIGEQKIDVIITDKPRNSIEQIALQTGVEI